MASAYQRFAPSTGPGYYSGNVPQYNQFQAQGVGNPNGAGQSSTLGPNNTPYVAPASPTEDGILLEPSLTYFVAMETAQGGPVSHLVVE